VLILLIAARHELGGRNRHGHQSHVHRHTAAAVDFDAARCSADGVDGVAVTPQVFVAVAVAFVTANVLPAPGPKSPEPT
jgi:hypothetical protein